MRWRRKLEREGVWWAQAADGSWSRWDANAADWVAVTTGPPGGVAPLEPATQPPDAPSPAPAVSRILREFLGTFVGIALPGVIALGLALLVLGAFSFVWNTFFVPWLGTPVRGLDVLVVMIAGTAAVALFLSIGITVARAIPTSTGIWIATGVAVTGAVGTLLVIAATRDLTPLELLSRKETAFAIVAIAASWGGVALRRWLSQE